MSSRYETIIADDGTVLLENINYRDISLGINGTEGRLGTELEVSVSYQGKHQFDTIIRPSYKNLSILKEAKGILPPRSPSPVVDGLRRYFAVEIGLKALVKNSPEYLLDEMLPSLNDSDPLLGFGIGTYFWGYDEPPSFIKDASQQFWDYARANHASLPEIRGVSELFDFAMTFSSYKEPFSARISENLYSNPTAIELARFLPRFLEQETFNTFSEFLENSTLEPHNTEIGDQVYRFVVRNLTHLKKRAVYQELVGTHRETLRSLIRANYTFLSRSTAETSVLELRYYSGIRDTYNDASDMLADFNSSFASLFGIVSEDSHAKAELHRLYERIVADHLPSARTAPEAVSNEFMVPIWIRRITESVEVSAEDIPQYIWFFESSEKWSKSDSVPKYVIRKMFRELDIADIAHIADSVIRSRPKETVKTWFAYLDKYDSYRDIPVEVGLELAKKR